MRRQPCYDILYHSLIHTRIALELHMDIVKGVSYAQLFISKTNVTKLYLLLQCSIPMFILPKPSPFMSGVLCFMSNQHLSTAIFKIWKSV